MTPQPPPKKGIRRMSMVGILSMLPYVNRPSSPANGPRRRRSRPASLHTKGFPQFGDFPPHFSDRVGQANVRGALFRGRRKMDRNPPFSTRRRRHRVAIGATEDRSGWQRDGIQWPATSPFQILQLRSLLGDIISHHSISDFLFANGVRRVDPGTKSIPSCDRCFSIARALSLAQPPPSCIVVHA